MVPLNNSAFIFQCVHLCRFELQIDRWIVRKSIVMQIAWHVLILSATCKVILWSISFSFCKQSSWQALKFYKFCMWPLSNGSKPFALSYCSCWVCFKWVILSKTVALWGVKINCKYFNYGHSPDVTKKQCL